jgi:glycosyltransferase involved in cell wall biosynthesis
LIDNAISDVDAQVMRVLHVVPTWWPAARYGGPIVSVRALCSALAGAGCRVSVCTTNVDGSGETPVALDRPWDDQGVEVHSFPSRLGRRLYYSSSMGRFLSRSTSAFAVVHTHSVFLWPTWKAARAARSAGVPYVVSPRGMLVPELIRARSSIPKRLWIAMIERSNLHHADLIHVTSEAERQDMLRLDLGVLPPIAVIPNGVEIPELSAAARRPDQILFVGRVSWKKGLDRLIEAMAGVADAQLLIAGPDDEGLMPELLRQARQLGVDSRLRFLGPVDSRERDRLLEQSTVLVVPSLSENFGNVVVEAMAAACPVVTTPGVGASEILLQAVAGVVCDGSPGMLRDAIMRVLKDPEGSALMGRNGRAYCADRLSWQTTAGMMRVAYEEIVDRRERQAC